MYMRADDDLGALKAKDDHLGALKAKDGKEGTLGRQEWIMEGRVSRALAWRTREQL
jgi:hypothetical protein